MDRLFRQKKRSPGTLLKTSSSRNKRQEAEFRLSWFVGLLAFSVYLLTLCPAVYPGDSARSVAAVLKLIPAAVVAHPVWQLAGRSVASLPVFDLPFRLNLFSALCGALATAMLFRLVSRLLFEFGQIDSPTCATLYYNYVDKTAVETEPSKERTPDDGMDYHAAILGGVVTALAFAFGAPFWSASVSFHPQTFDLLLLFATGNALANYAFKGNIAYCVLTLFLLGLGLLESVVFVLIAPVVFFLIFREANGNGHLSEAFTFLFLVSVVLGLCVGIIALVAMANNVHAFDFKQLQTLFGEVIRTNKVELLQGMPHLGWLLVLIETLLPLVAVFWGAPKFFRTYEPLERWLWGILNAVFTLMAIGCLLGLPHTPWFLARQTFHLPVFAGLATALTLGFLFAYWRLSLTLPQQIYDGDEYYLPPSRAQRLFFSGMAVAIGVIVVVAPFRALRDADGRKGTFADAFAAEILTWSNNALCLVTDGKLDMHILVQAHQNRRKLTVLPTFGEEASPQLPPAGKSRRPAPPQKETPVQFVERWLRNNPHACEQIAVMTSPGLWTRAGLAPVPHGLVYLGVQDPKDIDTRILFQKHGSFWAKIPVLLAAAPSRSPALEELASHLRQQVSRIANDLGVFLEDQHCQPEAIKTYTRAAELDEANLCALFNRYGLALQSPVARQEDIAACEEQIGLASKKRLHGFLFEQCSSQYGTLHLQPTDLLERLNVSATAPLVVQWISFNHSQLAANQGPLRPEPVAMTGQTGVNTLAQIVQDIRVGRKAAAEPRLRSFLQANPDSLPGWSVLADLLVEDKKFDEIADRVLPAMRVAAGEKGSELIDMLEGLMALKQSPCRPVDARTFFLRALGRRPNQKEAQDCLLRTDRLLGNIVLVEADVAFILKTDSNNCAANAFLGSIRLCQKRYDEAEKALRKSISVLPTAEALNDLSEVLCANRQFAEAEKAARHALRIAPGFYQAWDSLGSILTDQERLKEADAAFRCALALCPKDPHIHLNLAKLNIRMNKKQEARQILNEISPLVKEAGEAFAQDYAVLSKELNLDRATP